MNYRLAILSLALLLPDGAWAQGQRSPAETAAKQIILPSVKSNPVQIPRFSSRPAIDGKLDDEIWKAAAVFKDFYQIDPGDNIPPSKPTEVLMGYDEKCLYAGFRAYDEPGKVRANLPKRDQIWDDDYVGMFLDTFNDRRRAYALFFSARGIQADGILTEGRGEDYSVDILMESKGLLNADGFTVEVAIPFKSLRYQAGKNEVWNAHFFRRIKRLNNEMTSWMPISRDRSGTMNQAGQLTGFEGISQERTIEVIPSFTLAQTGSRVRTVPASVAASNPRLSDSGRFVNRPSEFDPGVSVKLGLSSTLTLDFTVNPDFAQVEADQPVVTANQRFPIFFQEKRPFFLEGIDLFQTPIQTVHTRTIIDPDLAMKLTGKRGRHSFGFLIASDDAPGNFSEEELQDQETLPTIAKFVDKNAYIGVVRVKRDVGKESSLGFIGTSYNFIEKHNHLAGIDGRVRVDPKTVFSFQLVGSTSKRLFFDPDADADVYRVGNAAAYYANYDISGRHFGLNFDNRGQSRDYRSDVGFNQRTNTNRNSLFLRYSSEPNPKGRLISWRVSGVGGARYDWQGRLQSWDNNIETGLSFAHQTFIGAGYNIEYERVFEEEFGAKRTSTRPGAFAGNDPERSALRKTVFAIMESNPMKQLSGFCFFAYNLGALDFDFGAGPRFPRVSRAAIADPDAPLDPGPGTLLEVHANINYQPAPSIQTSLAYTKSKLTRDDTGRVAFDDNIFSSRTTYQFTHFLFLRARMDYSTLSTSAQGQFLLGWTPNPGTAFYAGYNDDINYNGFNPFSEAREPGFKRNSRTFFIKMSYLFRRGL